MKLTAITIFVLNLVILIPVTVGAATPVYTPLVGLPGVTNSGDFNEFINALYFLSIGIAALLAVIKIVIAGVKYMLTDIVTTKGAAKSDIQGALIGLLIVLGAVLILSIINPQLVNVNFNPQATPNAANTPAWVVPGSLVSTAQPGDLVINKPSDGYVLTDPTFAALSNAATQADYDEVHERLCVGQIPTACPGNTVGASVDIVACAAGEWDNQSRACLIRAANLP